ncbi:hypothetical protein ACWC9T_39080 [Kitasatospora sp. NPDC001159]
MLVSDPALHRTLATRSAGDTPDERAMPISSSTHCQALPGPAFHPGSDARRTGLQDVDPSVPSAADCVVSASGAVRGPGTVAVAAGRSRWEDLAVARFLEIRRTRTPEPGDFDYAFPALIARTLSDLRSRDQSALGA